MKGSRLFIIPIILEMLCVTIAIEAGQWQAVVYMLIMQCLQWIVLAVIAKGRYPREFSQLSQQYEQSKPSDLPYIGLKILELAMD
jgi:hypothetical protein